MPNACGNIVFVITHETCVCEREREKKRKEEKKRSHEQSMNNADIKSMLIHLSTKKSW